MSSPPASPEPTKLAEALGRSEQDFVDLWRSMSSLWGVSPTMAEIHGLLFLTGELLSTDDLMSRLGISRGNVSMSLTKLLDWGLVRRVHRRGDRREYYEALGDVWRMFALVAAERKRREIDPMLSALRESCERLSPAALGDGAENEQVAERRRRVEDLLAFLSLMDLLAQRFFESHKSLRAALDLLSREPEA